MENIDEILSRYCPICQKKMIFIETCVEDENETKNSYGCSSCDIVVYVVQFN